MRRPVHTLCLLSTLAPSCLPFVSPPARISIGPGARLGHVSGAKGEPAGEPVVVLRGGIHPLGAIRDGDRKPFDVGVGYSYEGSSARGVASIHGPYVEVGTYPLAHAFNDRLAIRAGANAAVEALWKTDSGDAHLGLTAGPLVELTGSADGPFVSASRDGGVVLGAATGYWAVGLFGNASVRDMGEGLSATYSGGISLRIPLAVGVVCCAIPGITGGGSGSHGGGSNYQPARIPAQPTPTK